MKDKEMDDILENGIISIEEHEEIERHFRRDERLDAMAEGEKKGAKEKSINIAKNMLRNNFSINDIHIATGLSNKQIATLK